MPLVKLEAGRFRDARVEREFILDELGETGSIEWQRIDAQGREPFLDDLGLQGLLGLAVEPVRDRGRRLRRHEQADPEIVRGLGVARLTQGRNVREAPVRIHEFRELSGCRSDWIDTLVDQYASGVCHPGLSDNMTMQ